MLILSNIGLLILSISFLAGFINFCGVIDKVIPVVFQGYKTITCAVIFILLNISARFAYFITSLFF